MRKSKQSVTMSLRCCKSITLFLVICSVQCALAQSTADVRTHVDAGTADMEPARKLDREYERLAKSMSPMAMPLLLAAKNSPPEFAATVLLRVASKIPSEQIDAKIHLVQAAWDLASQAPSRFPTLVPASSTYLLGTAGSRRYESGLDQLSLQMKAIEVLSEGSPNTALDRFGTISLSRLPSRTNCSASSLPRADVYYDGARLLLANMKNDLSRSTFVLKLIDAVDKDIEVEPALKLAVALKPSSLAGQDLLAEHVSAMLKRARGDDQAFSYFFLGTISNMALLKQTLPTQTSATEQLDEEYGAYLTQHFAGTRCEANVTSYTYSRESRIIATLPTSLNVTEVAHQAHAIILESDSSILSKEPIGEQYFQKSASLAEILSGLPASTRLTQDQQDALDAFLHFVEYPSEPEDMNFDQYRSRCSSLHRLLVSLAPWQVDLRQRVADVELELLIASPVYKQDRDDWFYDARFLVDHMMQSTSQDRNATIAKLTASRQPVLVLYGELAAWEGRTNNKASFDQTSERPHPL